MRVVRPAAGDPPQGSGHSPVSDRVRLVGLVVAESLVVVGLHALGRLEAFRIPWTDLGAWLDRAPFEDVVGAALLLFALGLAYWLLVSTLAYLVATASGRPPLIRAVNWLTLPPIRRLTSRAVALSLAASTVAGPLTPAVANLGGSSSAREVMVEVGQDGRLIPPGTADSPDEPSEGPVVLPPHLGPGASPPPPPPVPPDTPGVGPTVPDGTVAHTVTVRRGDHMWSLSEDHLQRVTGRADLGEHQIARYWVRVINENRWRIRSGNPDLIYPGETLVLPPIEV